MEGATVTSLCMNAHNPLFPSTATHTLGVPLSHWCAKTLEADLVSRSNAPILTRIRIRYDYRMHNISDLFLDFKEKIPHSIPQINPYEDSNSRQVQARRERVCSTKFLRRLRAVKTLSTLGGPGCLKSK